MEKVKIPEGWTLKPMPEIIKWGSGGTPKATENTYYGGDIPWVVIGDLNDSIVTKTAKNITKTGYENSSTKMIQSGTLLVAMYGASIGKLGITGMECCTNQAIASSIEVNDVNVKFMFYYFLFLKQRLIKWEKVEHK